MVVQVNFNISTVLGLITPVMMQFTKNNNYDVLFCIDSKTENVENFTFNISKHKQLQFNKHYYYFIDL